MPDFSKCSNEDCELREKCYRFTCIPNPFKQSYIRFEPTKLTELLGSKNKQEIFCNYFKSIT